MDLSLYLLTVSEKLTWFFYSLISAVTGLWRWVDMRIHLVRLAEKIPGPRGLPIIGNALAVWPGNSLVLFQFCDALWKKYGTPSRVYIGPLVLITIGEAEDHEKVLSTNDYLGKGMVYKFMKPWLGEGILISSGKKWHSRRKALTPAFHFKILDQFVPVFHSCGDEFVRQLRKRADDGSAFDVWPLVKLLTLDVICETIMGVQMNAQTNSKSPYVNAVNDISAIVNARIMKPWLHPSFLFRLSAMGRRHKQCLDILHGTTDRVIQERKAELKKLSEEQKTLDVDDLGRKRRVAFLDLLLLAARDGSLSDTDIREEVDTFMFEGHDTTAAAISFTIFLLSRHPEVQEKIMAELESIFDPSEPLEPSIQELSELKYLEMVIKESMRIYPPVPAIAREITSDMGLNSCPLTVPTGTTLFLSFFILHRNPEVFPDPETFDPERFAPEQSVRRHPFAYLPFSAGSRNCIGQRFAMLEMKSLLAKVVWNFHILQDPNYEPNVIWEVVIKSYNGIYVRLQERSKTNN